jgi:PKD repeat protein
MKTSIIGFVLFLGVSSFAVAKTKHALFIGNSYTYVNNLPQVVADIAASTGDTLLFDVNAVGGYTLMNHSTDATSLSKIAAGGWDYVVLQEQSQMPSFPISQVQTDVFPYAHQLDSLIHVASPCAKTLFYMTWGRKNGDASNCGGWPPVCTYMGMDSLLRERYLTMANDNHALVAPAGPIWRKLRANFPSIELYQSDESHPSEAGTYAIACVFYSVIFQKNPLNISYNYTLATTDAQSIRIVAKAVAFDSLSYWNVGKFLPQADFQFANTANLQISFTNNTQYATTYSWQFGDGNSSTQINPVHNYTTAGTYTVRLIAIKCGVSDTIIKSVTVTSSGIEDAKQEVLHLFPNPVTNELHIVTDIKNIQSVYVTDLAGRKYNCTFQLKDKMINVGTEHLSSGIYTLTIEAEGKSFSTKFEKK